MRFERTIASRLLTARDGVPTAGELIRYAAPRKTHSTKVRHAESVSKKSNREDWPPERNDKKAEEIASCLSTAALKQQVDDMRDNIDDFQGEEKSDLELQLGIFETELEYRANAE